jgi:serine/threonine protein phosphatase PrpC
LPLSAITHFLKDMSIETDFSGTTFVCAVIRGNTVTCANVGDSRTTVAYRNSATGAIVAANITIDHKPDLPAEKVCINLKDSYVSS